MHSTPIRTASSVRTRLFGRLAIVAVALFGLSLTTPAEAGRRDRAGARELRQVQIVLKRVRRLEQVSLRSVERAPDATIRLLDLLVQRGADDAALEAIALRGSHKVAVQRRRLEDQLRSYTDGVIQTAAIVVLDDDGLPIRSTIDDLIEGTIPFLRSDLVSEDLIMEIIETRQSALNAIQDAALIAEARISAALDAALAANP